MRKIALNNIMSYLKKILKINYYESNLYSWKYKHI